MVRVLPKVIVATLPVAVAPLVLAWTLRDSGVVSSPLLAALLGGGLSLIVCQLAAKAWERSSGDVLFGELLVWGYMRRALQERRLSRAIAGTNLRRLAARLEAGDPYTHGHSRRVARYATLIAKRMGVSGAELARIRMAAAVHDVGKLETPREVLHKAGKLTDEEFELIKRHPVEGAAMVAALGDPELTAIVRHHHERLDGAGYPDRLLDEQIPLGARIIAVADTFDAITSARSYRAAKPHRVALEILRAEAGTQLDRDAVHAFRGIYRGRRGLGAWLALTDGGERLLAWIAGNAVTTPAQLAVIAAGTAIGSGAVALPASAARVATKPHVVATASRQALPTLRPSTAAVEHVSIRSDSAAASHSRGRTFHSSSTPLPKTGSGAGRQGVGTTSGPGPTVAPASNGVPTATSSSTPVPRAPTPTTPSPTQSSPAPVPGAQAPVATVQVGKPTSPVNIGATIGGKPSNAPVVSVGSNGDGNGLGVTVNVPGLTSIKLGIG